MARTDWGAGVVERGAVPEAGGALSSSAIEGALGAGLAAGRGSGVSTGGVQGAAASPWEGGAAGRGLPRGEDGMDVELGGRLAVLGEAGTEAELGARAGGGGIVERGALAASDGSAAERGGSEETGAAPELGARAGGGGTGARGIAAPAGCAAGTEGVVGCAGGPLEVLGARDSAPTGEEGRVVAGHAAAAASAGPARGSAVRAPGEVAGAGGPPVPPRGEGVRGAVVGGPAPVEVAVRGAGRPAPAGVAGAPGDVGARGAGVEGDATGVIERGQEGMVLVGMRSIGRPGVLGPVRWIVDAGIPGEVTGRPGTGPVGPPGASPGVALAGPGLAGETAGVGADGVRTGGRGSKAGPGRGMGVSIGICRGAPGGSSAKGAGVARGGAAGGCCRRSSGISRLSISGGGRVEAAPGSQAVQSPSGGNSAPHLRHLDTPA